MEKMMPGKLVLKVHSTLGVEEEVEKPVPLL
jgi:hypothetical protein